MRVLQEAGLLSRKNRGREHHCRLEQKRMKEAAAWIENHLRSEAAAARLRLPLDELEQHDLDPVRLLDEPMPAGLSRLLEQNKERLRHELRALPRLLNREERAAQRQGLVLAALHARLLERIDHRQGLARVRAEVPPWAKLWTAWRTAVRYA